MKLMGNSIIRKYIGKDPNSNQTSNDVSLNISKNLNTSKLLYASHFDSSKGIIKLKQ